MGQIVTKLRAGACTVTVFANVHRDGDEQVTLYSVALRRAYKDQQGRFQYTTSLRANDIPKAMLVLARAYTQLVLKEDRVGESA